MCFQSISMSYKCVAGMSVELFKKNSGVNSVQPFN